MDRKGRNLVPQKLDTSGRNGMGREQECFVRSGAMSLYDCLGECFNGFMNEKATRQRLQNSDSGIGMLGSLTGDSRFSSCSIPNLGPLRNQHWPSMLVRKRLLPCGVGHNQRRRVAHEEKIKRRKDEDKMTYVSRIWGNGLADLMGQHFCCGGSGHVCLRYLTLES